jgi:hypothetical protein
VDEHVRLMQSAAYFLRYKIKLERERFEDCSGFLVDLLDGALDLVAVGIGSGMYDMRTEET